MIRLIVSVVAALAFASPALAQLEEDPTRPVGRAAHKWNPCDANCGLGAIANANEMIIVHTDKEVTPQMANALVSAVQRGIRVQVYAQRAGQNFDYLKYYIDGFNGMFQELRRVGVTNNVLDIAPGKTGICQIRANTARPFLSVDPFAIGPYDRPAFIRLDESRATTHRQLVETAAKVIYKAKEFRECSQKF